MMLQLCTISTVHCNNLVWVPMPIIHPENWLPPTFRTTRAQRTVRPS